MTDQVQVEVELAEHELAALKENALDHHARVGDMITRYARPEERERVGRDIDPETALVFFIYSQTLAPYPDDWDSLPDEYYQVGREFFAVDPETGIAVHEHDLPEETRSALDRRRTAANREGWRRLLEATGSKAPSDSQSGGRLNPFRRPNH